MLCSHALLLALLLLVLVVPRRQQVAIYSPADRLQSHRYNADESYVVGNTDMQPVSCYLDIESIIKVAKEAEVDAIHPGYGFLSENTTFARRCEEEGIVFIGPKAETIEVRLAEEQAAGAAVRWVEEEQARTQSLQPCVCTLPPPPGCVGVAVGAPCAGTAQGCRTELHCNVSGSAAVVGLIDAADRFASLVQLMLCCAVLCVAVQAMGDKTAARRAAIACDVPIVPGTNQALQNVDEAKAFADQVGFLREQQAAAATRQLWGSCSVAAAAATATACTAVVGQVACGRALSSAWVRRWCSRCLG